MHSAQLPSLAQLRQAYQTRAEQILAEFSTFLSFASVSSEPEHQPHMQQCVSWLANYLEQMGFTTQLWPTSGHPVLFAEHCHAGPDQPTLLIYNHYDVQPVDPLEAWEADPFSATVRHGQVFARGAQDNKGQCFYVIQALKALLERDGRLPINIKLCIEGEEECGSAGLAAILPSKAEQLTADFLAIVDLGLPNSQQPAITLGLRGLVALDVHLQGANSDLHSGSHGGLVYNPLRALSELLASMYTKEGAVAIEGFYPSTAGEEQQQRLHMHFDAAEYEKNFGVPATGGEQRYSPLERNWLRPTVEINGLRGGYTGSGIKTVIPAEAWAKITCRLIPGQEPQHIGSLVAEFLKNRAPKGIKVDVQVHPGGGVAVRTASAAPAVQAFAKAFEQVFDAPCAFILEGASIPIVAQLTHASGAETVLLGLGLATDNIHAPNEHFGLDRFEKGLLIIARAIELLARPS